MATKKLTVGQLKKLIKEESSKTPDIYRHDEPEHVYKVGDRVYASGGSVDGPGTIAGRSKKYDDEYFVEMDSDGARRRIADWQLEPLDEPPDESYSTDPKFQK